MEALSTCPICQNAQKTTPTINAIGIDYHVNCPICGRFILTREAFDDYLDPLGAIGSKLEFFMRARIAHKIKTGVDIKSSKSFYLNSTFLKQFIADGCPGPSPREQATNAIRFIGDKINRIGRKLRNIEPDFYVIIGAPNPVLAADLLFELVDLKQIEGIKQKTISAPPNLLDVNLTLSGWQMYEDEKKGKLSGKYGFIALKFDDPVLEPLVHDVIKPTLKEQLGYDVVDMRDIARAGIIDNIMRAQIRDAAFVLVDLTHDNYGAYWESGYAEGLGKPVVYICEGSKFAKVQTHFDTNHCTTVIWHEGKVEEFKQQLVATLRRSLNLFS